MTAFVVAGSSLPLRSAHPRWFRLAWHRLVRLWLDDDAQMCSGSVLFGVGGVVVAGRGVAMASFAESLSEVAGSGSPVPSSVSEGGSDGGGVGCGVLSDADLVGLYMAHRLWLTRMAALLVDDVSLAEDLVQDAFMALHSRRSRLRDAGAVVGYLRKSVLNGARDEIARRQSRRRFLRRFGPSVSEVAGSADLEVLLADDHRDVLRGIRLLPPRQQEVLVLRYWSGLSEVEIADAMGISVGTVKSNASRALDKLEAILGGAR